MSANRIFVYGTLRKEGINAMSGLFPMAKFVAGTHVRGHLFDMGGYPAILPDEDGVSVMGEVYEIDDETLALLDEFELDADYHRTETEIAVNGVLLKCWMYAPSPELCAGRPEIVSGDWIAFSRGSSELMTNE